jgi:hypothetical protein
MASFLARTFSRRRPIEVSEIPELQETLRRSLQQNRVNNIRYQGIATDKLELFIMKLFHSENDPVQNKDYALAYIRELKPHLPESAILRMTQKVNDLENTNNPEPDLIGCILSLRYINKQYLPPDQRNQFPIDTFDYIDFYPNYLEKYHISENKIPILIHNIRVFLLSLLENNTARNVNKSLVREYFNLFNHHFNRYPDLVQYIRDTIIESLPNSNIRPQYLVNAIVAQREAQHEIEDEIDRVQQILSSDIVSLITWLTNQGIGARIRNDVIDDMTQFFTLIEDNEPFSQALGNRYIVMLRGLVSSELLTFFENHINYQPLQPSYETDTMLREFIIHLETLNNELLHVRLKSNSTTTKTPLHSIASIQKTPINSSTLENDTPISISCDEYITGFDPYFKRVEIKLKKICTLYTKSCDHLNDSKDSISDYLVKYRKNTYNISNIDTEYTLATAFKFWNTLDSHKKIQFGLARLENFKITYREGQGIGIGVVRDFFQNCIDELLRYNIFSYIGSESIQRYQINPLFNPDKTFKEESGLTFDKEADFVLFYKFIGRLFCFILLNDIGLNFHLSHAILAHMIYKHEDITDDDYLGYFMLDYPEYFNSYVKLMKLDPNTIKDLGFEFNDDYDLVTENKDITKTNFREYITLRSKHKLLHQIDNRDDKDTYNRFKGLISGFNPLRKLLAKEKLTISALDKLITFETIDDITIKKLIEKFKSIMYPMIEDTNDIELRDQNKIATDLLISILEDDGKTFPYEVINMEPPSDEEIRKKNFYNFIEHLLSFWSSYRHYSESLNYKISVISKVVVNEEIQDIPANTLPKSHTCYTTIDIPVPYHDKRDILYKKLIQAVYLGEKGIGNLGGGYKKTQYKILERSSKKSKTIYKNKSNFYIKDQKTYKNLFPKKGGNPVKYIAVFCANSDIIRDKTMILMKSVIPDHDIIYIPMGTVGDQTCKVDVLDKGSVYNFLSDVQCSKLPMYAKFDAVIFENCPIMGTFQYEFFNDKTISIWKDITHEHAPFYLGFFTDENLKGIDFKKHAISKYMNLNNHYRILDDQKELNVFEYKLV